MSFFDILNFGDFMDYIKGYYRSSIFEKDTFIIGLFKVEDTTIDAMKPYVNRTITFKGNFEMLNKKEQYIFYGECVTHPKYGFQYDVSNYETVIPEDKDGVIEYLSSGIFKGIGKKIAKKIVDILGDDALDKIIADKSVLDDIPKLSKLKKELIYNTLKDNEESRKTIVELTNYGFSVNDSSEIYKKYKENTLKVIEHNPYELIDNIKNITFVKIDDLKKSFDISLDDVRRIEACIIYVMKTLSFESGDTYSYLEEIVNGVKKYNHNNISEELIKECIDNLVSNLEIIREDEKYFLEYIYNSEEYIANRISELAIKKVDNFTKVDKFIKELEKKNNINYNDTQKLAIKKSINNNITIITGGPGVGKTTIIKAIINIYRRIFNLDYDALVDRIMLLAPKNDGGNWNKSKDYS